MAVTLLRVLVLGAIVAAADDVPITWCSTPRASLACVVPASEKVQPRRPPPPLEGDDRPRTRLYRWWRGTEEIKRVLSNGTIEVSKKKDGSTEGVYQCAARHRGGLVLGYPINLKFAYIDKFYVHPENATARIGQPFVLSCYINSGPGAVVSWHKDGVPLADDSRYNLLINELLITDVRSDDAGLYRCKATNIQVNKTKFSHGGRLVVEEGPGDLKPALLPLNFSSSVVASKGSSIVLPCPATGSPRPKMLWMFTHPGDRTAELEDVAQILTLRHLDASQEGVYNCSIEGNSNITRSFNVKVNEPVVITVPPSSKHTLGASTVRFNCTAVGSPPPKVTWYKDGELLELTGRKAVLHSADGTRWELLIRSVISSDRGVYQCFASNGVSTASAWAMLNVSGSSVAPPSGLQCWPLGHKTVRVMWNKVAGNVTAYTMEITKPGELSNPSLFMSTDQKILVTEPLTPYDFQVRVYVLSEITKKNEPSDLSESVTCQGQGVPIKLTCLEDSVLVSWKQFARQNPGVVQWILQYMPENSNDVFNITLDGGVLNYTLKVDQSKPVLIRVLGTKILPWVHQNLTQVPWTSSTTAGSDIDDREETDLPKELQVIDVGSREFTIRWRYDEADSNHGYSFLVCTTKLGGVEDCFKSDIKSATVSHLQPGSNYMVRVKINGKTASSAPIHITTKPDGPQRFKDVTYEFINASTLSVSWNSNPAKYTVNYSNELKLPIVEWASVETIGNSVLITGLDLTKRLYVMVTGYDPEEHSTILQIPIQVQEDLKYTLTSTGLTVTWNGQGPRVVKYSQNLTLSMDKWSVVNVPSNTVHITGLDPSLPTHVVISPPGSSQQSQALTIPGRPPETNQINTNQTSLLFLWVGVTCGVIILCALTITAICVWRSRKRSRSPVRSHRRRNVSPHEKSEEEGAEMKNIGGRLANGGGAKEAGEPLLNGHVHITENPNQSKTPNGRMRKGRRYEAAFDVARYDDPDTTLETVLDPDTSTSTTYNLLDTSRRPEFDVSRSYRDVSANNSLNKLPDDNMNSELTRSTDFQLDNSKILPTLQPNG